MTDPIDAVLLRNLADKQAITEQIYRYCRAVDRIDLPLGHSIWHDDAYADYGADIYQGPGKDVIDTILRHHASLISHSHNVTNVLIDLAGDRAGSEAYVCATMRRERDGQLLQLWVWGRYLDAWERRDGRWGIVHRTVVFDHDEIRPVTPLGRPSTQAHDRTDPSYQVLFNGGLG
jgi:ketosteroid isomerase-like protein